MTEQGSGESDMLDDELTDESRGRRLFIERLLDWSEGDIRVYRSGRLAEPDDPGEDYSSVN